MLRSGNNIRLTSDEISTYRELTGTQKVPTNLNEYNAALEDAALFWEQEDPGPESKLMAVIIRDRKVA